ncbi:peroxidasin homolog [Mobula birostris]|uniref:peroxidasin homolog n=1 Tax=Mobula birostris TaxID=1983395 RepID=UPI003B287F70
MKDRSELQEDGNIALSFENNIATLQINAVGENHAGKYTCQVQNDAGTEQCFATLLVAEPAKITEQAQSLRVTAGNAANLECTVTGTPELTVKCFKDGNEMVSSRKHRISIEHNVVSLKIPSVSNEDTGEYTFEVKNQFGTSSCKASLTVLDQLIPPVFTRKLRKMDSVLGSSVQMECKVSGSLPMSFSWYKDGILIMTSEKYKILSQDNTTTLEVNQLELSDRGIYVCKAANSVGSDECSGFLNVTEPPSFIEKPLAQESLPGSTVQFRSVVKGSAPLTIKWLKDGRELMSGADYFILSESSTSLLELFSAKVSDSGDYICEVSNKVGSASCAARLFIKEPPYFIMRLEPTAIFRKGETASFECKITGTPEIKVTWFKNHHEICASEKYKISFIDSVAFLEITDVSLDDSGNYTCEVQNEAGTETCDMTVTVKGVHKLSITFNH